LLQVMLLGHFEQTFLSRLMPAFDFRRAFIMYYVPVISCPCNFMSL